jgi:hypothetical protein
MLTAAQEIALDVRLEHKESDEASIRTEAATRRFAGQTRRLEEMKPVKRQLGELGPGYREAAKKSRQKATRSAAIARRRDQRAAVDEARLQSLEWGSSQQIVRLENEIAALAAPCLTAFISEMEELAHQTLRRFKAIPDVNTGLIFANGSPVTETVSNGQRIESYVARIRSARAAAAAAMKIPLSDSDAEDLVAVLRDGIGSY